MTTAALVVAISEAIEGALCCLEEAAQSAATIGAEACLRSARATIAALADVVEPPGTIADPLPPNSDDPATCGHNPPYIDLPGQTMCSTCGASLTEDGQWIVL